jgi:hypothetical protein
MASLVNYKIEEDYDQLYDLLAGKYFVNAWSILVNHLF